MIKQDIKVLSINSKGIYEVLYVSVDGIRDSLEKKSNELIPKSCLTESNPQYIPIVTKAIDIAVKEYGFNPNGIIDTSLVTTKYKSILK